MRRLRFAVAECNYQELDRQLKEQFINGLNDKDMLGEIIKELTASRCNDQTTSSNVLIWAKRVEAHRVQAAVMNSITESIQFDKIKVSRSMHKESPKRPAQSSTLVWQACRYCSSFHPPRQCPAQARCAWVATRSVTLVGFVGVRRPGQYTRWSRRPYNTRPVRTLK